MTGAVTAIEMANDAGITVDQAMQDAVDILQPSFTIFSTACDNLDGLVTNFGGLLVPGFCGIIASVYCLFIVDGLCCAAKCCSSPKVTGKVDTSATINKAVQDV